MDWKETVQQILELHSDADPERNTEPAPAFQLYPRQWLGDDAVDLMSMEERGVHFNLMLRAWQQGPPCSVPDEADLLRGWCRMGEEKWAQVWPAVSRGWRLYEGRWWQLGLCRTYLKQLARRRQTRSAARKRWANGGGDDGGGSASPVAAPSPGGGDRDSAPPQPEPGAYASVSHCEAGPNASSSQCVQNENACLSQCPSSSSSSSSSSAAAEDPPLNPPQGGEGAGLELDLGILIPCTGLPSDPTAPEFVSPGRSGFDVPMWGFDTGRLEPPVSLEALRQLRQEILSGSRPPPSCQGARRMVTSWLRAQPPSAPLPVGQAEPGSVGRIRAADIDAVFAAHDHGIESLRKLQGERFRHHARTNKRRRLVAKAIREHGLDRVRHAARNLPLSEHHREKDYLGLDYALRDVERHADRCDTSEPAAFLHILQASLERRGRAGARTGATTTLQDRAARAARVERNV